MSFLSDLANILQKPQSAAMGTYAGLMRMIDPEQDVENRLGVGKDPLTGFLAGIKGNISPSDAAKSLENNYTWGQDPIEAKIMNTIANIGVDPLLLAGPAIKGGVAGTKAAGIASKLGGVGAYADDISRSEKMTEALARAMRRTYQGTLATGDPLSGFAAGQLMGLGENTMAKVMPSVLGRVAGKAETVADDIPSAVQTKGGIVSPQGDMTGAVVPEGPGNSSILELMAGPPVRNAQMLPDNLGAIAAGPQGIDLEALFPSMAKSPLDEAAEAVAQALPAKPKVLLDPMLQGRSREQILEELDAILRNNQ